jgi:hypothetical protein
MAIDEPNAPVPANENANPPQQPAAPQPAVEANADEPEKPAKQVPISKEISQNWGKIILVGIYLLFVMLIGVYLLASLMMVETDKGKIEAKACANSNKPCPTPSPTASPVSTPAPAAATTANTAPPANTSAGTNINRPVNGDGDKKTATTATNVNANSPTPNPAPSATPDQQKFVAVVVPKEVYLSVPLPFSFSISAIISADSYVFLIVLFAGMLGGVVRGMYSYVKHLGMNDFSIKWLGYYFTLPYTGAALSIIIYFVIRGGFGGTSFGDGLTFNPFSFAALAALTGLFTENAMDKLKQVADTLLAPSTPKVTNAKEMIKERNAQARKGNQANPNNQGDQGDGS